MKRILLASTAMVAFAGAANAESHLGISWAGDAELGWNDDFDDGIFWSLGLTLTGTMELDNGLTASISGDVELINSAEVDDNGTPGDTTDDFIVGNGSSAFDGNEVEIDDLVIGLSSDMASLRFGDTAPAADALWSSPVTNLDADDFNDEDDLENEDAVLIGRMSIGESEFAVSYGVVDTNGEDDSAINDGSDDDLVGLQVGVTTTIGGADIFFAYQEEVEDLPSSFGDVDLTDTPEIIAFGVQYNTGPLELGFAIAQASAEEDTTGIDADLLSVGIQGAYTVGDITVGAFYVSQDLDDPTATTDFDDNYGIFASYGSGPVTVDFLYHGGQDEDLQLNGTYDVGNGLELFAGYRDEMENGAGVDQAEIYYVGGDYDLGGGATLRLSYADVDEGPGGVSSTLDELGPGEDIKEGGTIVVSFSF
ncbi:MAG: porin [Pseudomonadota bacterium]